MPFSRFCSVVFSLALTHLSPFQTLYDTPFLTFFHPPYHTHPTTSQEEEKKKEGGKGSSSDDWWTGASYKGKTFLPLSNDPDKVRQYVRQ